MSANISQDEINAMLGLGDQAAAKEESPPLDLDSLLEKDPNETEAEATAPAAVEDNARDVSDFLTTEEVDLLGEIGNICMGAVATTMYMLLDRRVSITTPCVNVYSTYEVLQAYETPFVIVDVRYVEGIEGKNVLLLKENDAMLITDLLMGGDGQVESGAELSEIHMSAISEIMNQMIGASATSLSNLLSRPVNISPPISEWIDANADVSDRLDASELVVKISFDMEIEGLLKSQLLQLMPYQLGKDLAQKMVEVQRKDTAAVGAAQVTPPTLSPAPPPPAPTPAPPLMPTPAAMPLTPTPVVAPPAPTLAAPPPPYASPAPTLAAPPPPYAQLPYAQPPYTPPSRLVDVSPATYPAFDPTKSGDSLSGKSLDIVADIPLQVSVELGKTKKTISDILEFSIGTIVVLDKMAGEHVEVLVNGKLIAAGEVVVIDENYGVRITDVFD